MVREAPAQGNPPLDGIAQAFVEARRNCRSLANYPGTRPATLAAAYHIQDAAIRLDGRAVAGWKVGRIPDPEVSRLGCDRLVGPIFAGTVIEGAPDIEMPMPAYAGGFIAIEAEFMLRVRVPPRLDLPGDDLQTLDWIDEVRIGIEVASSPYAGINDDGPCVTVSDFGNNACVLLGPAVPEWRTRDLRTIEVMTEVAGREVGRAAAQSMLDGPFGSVRFLLEHLRSRGIAPQGGWWISSGAVTGVHIAAIGDRAAVHFAGVGSLACRLVAAAQ